MKKKLLIISNYVVSYDFEYMVRSNTVHYLVMSYTWHHGHIQEK